MKCITCNKEACVEERQGAFTVYYCRKHGEEQGVKRLQIALVQFALVYMPFLLMKASLDSMIKRVVKRK